MTTANRVQKRRTANPRASKRASTKPAETVSDFKTRIALMMRAREGRPCSVLGAAHADPCVVRKN